MRKDMYRFVIALMAYMRGRDVTYRTWVDDNEVDAKELLKASVPNVDFSIDGEQIVPSVWVVIITNMGLNIAVGSFVREEDAEDFALKVAKVDLGIEASDFSDLYEKTTLEKSGISSHMYQTDLVV